jgi:hypothetical protein
MAPMFTIWDIVYLSIIYILHIAALTVPILLLFKGSKKVNYITNGLILVGALFIYYFYSREFIYAIPPILSILIKSQIRNT